MYSRFPKRPEHPIRIPEHYSGCAFSEAEPKEPDIDIPLSPAPQDPPDGESFAPSPPPPPNNPPEAPPKPPHSELSSLFGGSLSLFQGGLNFEELLLIGLIILLSRTEQDSDVILWLALLLFCK